ncbi:hypothetical protein VaNZ11_007648, partial [Volvox africanus]
EVSASLPPPPLPPWPLPWPTAPVGESPVAVPLPSVSVLRSKAASRGRPASPPSLELELDTTTADPPADDPTTSLDPNDEADAPSPAPLPILTPAPGPAGASNPRIEAPGAVELPSTVGSEPNSSTLPIPTPPPVVLTEESKPTYELIDDTPPRAPSPEPSPAADALPPYPLLQIATPNPSPSPPLQDTVSASAEVPPVAVQTACRTSDGPSQDASDGRGSPSCTIPNPAVQNPHVILPLAPEPTGSDSSEAPEFAAAHPQREAEPGELLDSATTDAGGPPEILAPDDGATLPPIKAPDDGATLLQEAPSAAEGAVATFLEADPGVTAEGESTDPSV